MTTLIITEHYSPSVGATAQLITDLVKGLRQYNHETIVLTSTHNDIAEVDSQIIRFRAPLRSTTSVLSKALSGNVFLVCSLLWALRNHRLYSKILIVSNPPYSGIIGLLIKLLLNKKYCFLFQDIFPRSAILAGILPARGPLPYCAKLLMRTICQNSHAVIVLSRDMQRRCMMDFGTSVKTVIIPNWSVVHPQIPQALNAKHMHHVPVRLQYSGNHGRLHDIITILEAARVLFDKPILFQFIGGGPKYHYIQEYISHFNLSNVTLLPYQSRDSLERLFSSCDASFVSLMPGAEDTVAPSKLYGILASAKPVILLTRNNNHLADLLSSSNAGYVVEPGDVNTLVQLLSSFVGNQADLIAKSHSAYKLYLSSFQKEQAVTMYHSLLAS